MSIKSMTEIFDPYAEFRRNYPFQNEQKLGCDNEREVIHNITSEFIESNTEFWGPEFAAIANVEHKPEHDVIVAMGCHTMCYHIADNFRGGEFRTEILDDIFGRKAHDIGEGNE